MRFMYERSRRSVKSPTNSARSSRVRPAQWREGGRGAGSAKAEKPPAGPPTSAPPAGCAWPAPGGARRNRSKAEYFRRAFKEGDSSPARGARRAVQTRYQSTSKEVVRQMAHLCTCRFVSRWCQTVEKAFVTPNLG